MSNGCSGLPQLLHDDASGVRRTAGLSGTDAGVRRNMYCVDDQPPRITTVARASSARSPSSETPDSLASAITLVPALGKAVGDVPPPTPDCGCDVVAAGDVTVAGAAVTATGAVETVPGDPDTGAATVVVVAGAATTVTGAAVTACDTGAALIGPALGALPGAFVSVPAGFAAGFSTGFSAGLLVAAAGAAPVTGAIGAVTACWADGAAATDG
jgi:hypothetical protein